jgi:hypothetical protein
MDTKILALLEIQFSFTRNLFGVKSSHYALADFCADDGGFVGNLRRAAAQGTRKYADGIRSAARGTESVSFRLHRLCAHRNRNGRSVEVARLELELHWWWNPLELDRGRRWRCGRIHFGVGAGRGIADLQRRCCCGGNAHCFWRCSYREYACRDVSPSAGRWIEGFAIAVRFGMCACGEWRVSCR